MINRVFCFVGEENGVKYLKIDKGDSRRLKILYYHYGVKYLLE